MKVRTIVLLVVLVLVVTLALNSFFIVDERQKAIILRFGEAKPTYDAAGDYRELVGFHIKIPIADEIKFFDGRILTLDTTPERFYTSEKKPLIVDSFVKWRIHDTIKYYENTGGNEVVANQILEERVNEGLRNQVGRRDMHEVVSGERDQLMLELTSNLDRVMRAETGITVIDVRVKRIDLPTEVSTTVFERMMSERKIEANQYRATGTEQSLAIEADANRQKVVIEAEAFRDAEQIRGDGDAEAAKIYAEAYGQDPEFYEFYRSINAYITVFQEGNSLMVLDPSSDFFKYLKSESGD